MNFVFESDVVDHSNESTPIQREFYYHFTKPIFSEFSDYSFFLKSLTYITDKGFIFENKAFEKGMVFDPYIVTSKFSKKDPTDLGYYLANYEIKIALQEGEEYIRNYQKLQSVIANIGGMLSFISTIGYVIVLLATGNVMFVELAYMLIQDKSMYRHKSKKKIRIYSNDTNTICSPKVITVKNDNEMQKAPSNNVTKNDKTNDEMIIMKNGKVLVTNQSMISTCSSQRNRIQKINDINCKDFCVYLFSCKKAKGAAMIALCEDIYKEYLS